MEEDKSAVDGRNWNFRYARKPTFLLLEATRLVYNINRILGVPN
jgi:hypothetical protein